MRRTSLFWPTVVAAVTFLLLLALGTWQLERLAWKDGLIAARRAGLSAPPVALPDTLAAARPLDFHHVATRGTFLNDREFYLGPVNDGGEGGYEVVTPLRRPDGSVLLVNRGFVPQDRKDPGTRAAGELSGEIQVAGVLRLPQARHGWFVPPNQPAQNQWFTMDIPAMAAAAKLDRVLPFYIEADATPNPGGLPVGGQTRDTLPNNHLQYAITWYTLAGALAVIYIRVARRRSQGEMQ